MKKGNKLILYLNNPRSFIFSFWGALYGGIIPVPIAVGENAIVKDRLNQVFKELDDVKIIVEQNYAIQIKEMLDINDEDILIFEEIDFNGSCGKEEKVEASDIAFIQFSSGSTSKPKGVVLTHENLMTNMNAICKGIDIQSHDKTVSWMPLTHDMGLIGFHLCPIYGGISQVLMPPAIFIKNPIFYLQVAQRLGGTIICCPNFGIKHILNIVNSKVENQLDLRKIRILFNGAEPISYELCTLFIEKMSKFNLNKNVMFPVYGMAEASLAITFPKCGQMIEKICINRKCLSIGKKIREVDSSNEDATTFVKVGAPVLDCEVIIFDEEDQELPENTIGNICIRGKNVTEGYYKNIGENKKLKTEEGWLRTGDIGFFNQGNLVITGRKKDIIFINGQNFYPHDLEKLIDMMNVPGYMGSAVCGIPNESQEDEIIIFIARAKSDEVFQETGEWIRKYISGKLGKEVKGVIPIQALPKTSSGKVQRFKLIEQFLEGKYDDYLMNQQNSIVIETEALSDEALKIKDIFKSILKKEDIISTQNFFELGGDSLKAVYLINKINDEFEIKLEMKDVFKAFTVKDIAQLVKNKEKRGKTTFIKAPKQEYYEVLPNQSKYYFINSMSNTNTMFNIIKCFEYAQKLDGEKIKFAIEELTRKNEVLRANFMIINDKVCQKIHQENRVDFIEKQINYVDIDKFISDYNRPFKLEEDILMKCALLNTEKGSVLVICVHHIIGDGTAFGLLLKELINIYNNGHEEKVDEHKFTLKDYVFWRQSYKQTEDYLAHKNYWLEKLKEEVPALNLLIVLVIILATIIVVKKQDINNTGDLEEKILIDKLANNNVLGIACYEKAILNAYVADEYIWKDKKTKQLNEEYDVTYSGVYPVKEVEALQEMLGLDKSPVEQYGQLYFYGENTNYKAFVFDCDNSGEAKWKIFFKDEKGVQELNIEKDDSEVCLDTYQLTDDVLNLFARANNESDSDFLIYNITINEFKINKIQIPIEKFNIKDIVIQQDKAFIKDDKVIMGSSNFIGTTGMTGKVLIYDLLTQEAKTILVDYAIHKIISYDTGFLVICNQEESYRPCIKFYDKDFKLYDEYELNLEEAGKVGIIDGRDYFYVIDQDILYGYLSVEGTIKEDYIFALDLRGKEIKYLSLLSFNKEGYALEDMKFKKIEENGKERDLEAF